MEESQCEEYEDLRATIRPKTKSLTIVEPAGLAEPECTPSSQSEYIDSEDEGDIQYGVDAMKELFSSLELRVSQQSKHFIIFCMLFHSTC